ncbi:MAG TPA: YggT family protein [Dongiaceae bacterium]|jgi:YggT family protein|nr:YggT family protein [Dongiaceae bacterium]
MRALSIFVHDVIWLYTLILLVFVVLSWLISLRIVNMSSPIVRSVYDFSWRLTDPALRPIRRLLPNLGGIDISPVVLILLLQLVQNLLAEYVFPLGY